MLESTNCGNLFRLDAIYCSSNIIVREVVDNIAVSLKFIQHLKNIALISEKDHMVFDCKTSDVMTELGPFPSNRAGK